MNDLILLLICFLYSYICLHLAPRWRSPFVAFFGCWAAIFAIRVVLPLGQFAMNGKAALILASGLTAILIGLLVAAPSVESETLLGSTSRAGARIDRCFDTRRLLTAAGILLGAVAVGQISYRGVIRARSGSEFEYLTRQEVLYFQTHVDSSAPLLLLMSLAPVLAALGIILGRYHRWGYIFTVAALASSVQSPSRTATISSTGIALLMYLWVRGRNRDGSAPSHGYNRLRKFVLLCATSSLAIAYFNIEGSALKKQSSTSADLPEYLHFLATPLIYFTGSPSALSVAVQLRGAVPPSADPLRSIWLLPRILSELLSEVPVPNTVAGFVGIPGRFNTYTMFGDLYFDFGLVGTVLGSLLLGLLTGFWHRRSVRDPRPLNAWISAVLIVILFGGVAGFRLFWLDTATWLAAGALVFRWSEPRVGGGGRGRLGSGLRRKSAARTRGHHAAGKGATT